MLFSMWFPKQTRPASGFFQHLLQAQCIAGRVALLVVVEITVHRPALPAPGREGPRPGCGIEMARKFQEAAQRGEALGLNHDEMAFYDALATNEAAVRGLGDETLKKIAVELTPEPAEVSDSRLGRPRYRATGLRVQRQGEPPHHPHEEAAGTGDDAAAGAHGVELVV